MKKILTVTLLLCTIAPVAADPTTPAILEGRRKALIVLNRLGFGARPGDVDKVLAKGIMRYVDDQLHPERIGDTELEARLRAFPSLSLSNDEILERYFEPLLEARRERKHEAAMEMKSGDAAPDPSGAKEKLRKRIPPDQRPQRLIEELSAARILRATESERQLNEVMVDFWMNHFNVYAKKGMDRVLLTSYERDTIRPHVWGRFEDLLMDTAKSPAMLFYLDNARSVADPQNRPQMGRMRGRRLRGGFGRPMDDPAEAPKKKGGLNENYAREIMELHTLGVDAGYTQKDVTELARVFTGWTIAPPKDGGGFIFRPRLHDAGAKTVLGNYFPPGGGIEEGERMIHVLAHSPATAHHISLELCRRLVSDDPPATLVDRVAKTFLASDGDLRVTVREIVTSPEFFEPRYDNAKIKSPFEFVVSAIRASNSAIINPVPLIRELDQMGEGLYLAQPPTGYSDLAGAWVNSGALLARLNFALALSASKIPGTQTDVAALVRREEASDPERAVDAMALALTGGQLTPGTRETVRARITADTKTPGTGIENSQLPTIAGLILGSPEFQRE